MKNNNKYIQEQQQIKIKNYLNKCKLIVIEKEKVKIYDKYDIYICICMLFIDILIVYKLLIISKLCIIDNKYHIYYILQIDK